METVTVKMPESLVHLIDVLVKKHRVASSRSELIREAVKEYIFRKYGHLIDGINVEGTSFGTEEGKRRIIVIDIDHL